MSRLNRSPTPTRNSYGAAAPQNHGNFRTIGIFAIFGLVQWLRDEPPPTVSVHHSYVKFSVSGSSCVFNDLFRKRLQLFLRFPPYFLPLFSAHRFSLRVRSVFSSFPRLFSVRRRSSRIFRSLMTFSVQWNFSTERYYPLNGEFFWSLDGRRSPWIKRVSPPRGKNVLSVLLLLLLLFFIITDDTWNWSRRHYRIPIPVSGLCVRCPSWAGTII